MFLHLILCTVLLSHSAAVKCENGVCSCKNDQEYDVIGPGNINSTYQNTTLKIHSCKNLRVSKNLAPKLMNLTSLTFENIQNLILEDGWNSAFKYRNVIDLVFRRIDTLSFNRSLIPPKPFNFALHIDTVNCPHLKQGSIGNLTSMQSINIRNSDFGAIDTLAINITNMQRYFSVSNCSIGTLSENSLKIDHAYEINITHNRFTRIDRNAINVSTSFARFVNNSAARIDQEAFHSIRLYERNQNIKDRFDIYSNRWNLNSCSELRLNFTLKNETRVFCDTTNSKILESITYASQLIDISLVSGIAALIIVLGLAVGVVILWIRQYR